MDINQSNSPKTNMAKLIYSLGWDDTQIKEIEMYYGLRFEEIIDEDIIIFNNAKNLTHWLFKDNMDKLDFLSKIAKEQINQTGMDTVEEYICSIDKRVLKVNNIFYIFKN